MALQSLLHDPSISSFLDQIPQNQRIITLKQLIYIGIKIVTNQFNKQPTPNRTLNEFENKQNILMYSKKQKPLQKSNKKNTNQELVKQKQAHKINQTVNNQKNDKIQSTLLRQISKIRIQLQTLTNKVYDHYFDQSIQLSEHNNSLSFNKKKNINNDHIVSYGFGQNQQIPTFSPQRNQKVSKSRSLINPFLKQKSGLHNIEVQTNNKIPGKKFEQKIIRYPNQQYFFETRNRAKSNLHHLDDTQVRQALYKQDQSQSESEQKVRSKKSQSVIQKRHQMKKKDQQNFFYQLNIEKQRLNQLKKFQQSKNAPQSSYRQFSQNLPLKVDLIKKKAKSKIKPDVERDRLRYQNRVQEENFKKGFEQYEYSANEGLQEEDEYEEEVSEKREEQDQQENVQDFEDNQEDEQEEQNQRLYQKHDQSHPHQSSNHQYMNSPQQEYERQRDISQPNFGFYDSHGRSSSSGTKQRMSYNSHNIKNDRVINASKDQSSFSQFSEFSMSSNNSKRENGKISRRRID